MGAYFGLVPRNYQSGEIDRTRRITKVGDPMARTALFKAAKVKLSRTVGLSALKAWAIALPPGRHEEGEDGADAQADRRDASVVGRRRDLTSGPDGGGRGRRLRARSGTAAGGQLAARSIIVPMGTWDWVKPLSALWPATGWTTRAPLPSGPVARVPALRALP